MPHFDQPGTLQIVTIRLVDSLPVDILRRIKARIPRSRQLLRNQHIESHLDSCHGECWLRDPEHAKTVQDSLLHFDDERYRLLAWVIMPNHVHVVFETRNEYPLPKLMFSLKGYTAREINKKLGRTGPFWQREYFDRAVRDETHFRNAVEYIHNNPVKAKLVCKPEDWPFSSAASDKHTSRQQCVLG